MKSHIALALTLFAALIALFILLMKPKEKYATEKDIPIIMLALSSNDIEPALTPDERNAIVLNLIKGKQINPELQQSEIYKALKMKYIK